MIELQQFDGLNTDEIIARLETLGFTRFADKPPKAFAAGQAPGPQSVFMFRRPQGGPVITFSTQPGLSETFAALCREDKHNPFLPKILAERDNGKGIHLIVLEELRSADELGNNRPGIARAFATMVNRSRLDHRGVHKVLLRDLHAQPWLSSAIRGIARKLSEAFNTEAPLDYNARTKHEAPVAGPNCVLFRTTAQQEKTDVMEGMQPVFAAPFRQATEAVAAEKNIRRICRLARVPFAP